MSDPPRSRLDELRDALRGSDAEDASPGHDAFTYFDAFAREVRHAMLLELEADAVEGMRIGAYRTQRVIGRGGMGAVFLATRDDGAFEQRVALKVLHVGEDRDDVVARLVAERRILSRLEHPGIARIIDGGSDVHGRPYLAMEFVEGVSIVEHCRAHRLGIRDRLALMRAVADVVAFAHRNLVVHRDLKPGNIFIDTSGRVKLLDFGIAKVLGDTESLSTPEAGPMTPEYAAPEQIGGAPVTTLTDVHGLGCVLYELLCGQRPFVRGEESPQEFEARVLRDAPRPPSEVAASSPDHRGDPSWSHRVRGDLDAICLMALQKDPGRRHQSAAEFAADLDRYLADLPVQARPESHWRRARRFARRHRWPLVSAAAIGLGGLATTVTLAVQGRAVARERDRAQQMSSLLLDVFTVADPAQATGERVTARDVVARGAARVERELVDQPSLQVDLLEVVGRVYRNLGLYEQSADVMRRAVDMRRTMGAAGPLADAVHWLGLALHDRGDYASAEAAFRESLTLAGSLPRDAARGVRASTYLGLALLRQNELAEARSHLEASVGRARAVREVPALELADALTGLGMLHLARGAFAAAEAPLREALEIRRTALHPAHVLIAETENNLASALGQLGRLADAETLQREAIARLRDELGGNHPRVATALNNLGLVHMAQQRPRDAEPLFREANAIRRATLGARHPDLAQGLSNLGLLLQSAGSLDEASALLTEALAIRRDVFGATHVAVAQALNNLALLDQSRGQLGAAEARLREALTILRASLGRAHPLVATSANNLALVIAATRTGEAEALFREALEIRRLALPPGHAHTAYALVGLGEHLLAGGRVDDAERLLREALEMRRAQAPSVPWEVAEVESALGECVWRRARRAEGQAAVAASWPAVRDGAPPGVQRKVRSRMSRLGITPEQRTAPQPGSPSARR